MKGHLGFDEITRLLLEARADPDKCLPDGAGTCLLLCEKALGFRGLGFRGLGFRVLRRWDLKDVSLSGCISFFLQGFGLSL